MRRLPLISILLITITIGVIVAVYLILKDFQKKALQTSVDPFEYVPSHAEIIYHVRQPELFRESFTRTGPLGQDINVLFTEEKIPVFIDQLDSLIRKNPDIMDHWSASELVLSLHRHAEEQKKSFLLQITLPAVARNKTIHDFIQEQLFFDKTFHPFEIDGQTVFSIKNETNPQIYYYSIRDNLLVFSSDSSLITISGTASRGVNSIYSDPRFTTLKDAAGRFSDNIYLSISALCELAGVFQTSNYPLNIPCEEIAGWQLWDVSYQAGELHLTGFAQSGTHGQKFTDNLAGQQKTETDIAKHIPLHTRRIFFLGLSDVPAFSEKFAQWMLINQRQVKYNEYRTRFFDLTSIEPDSVEQLWSGELAWIQSDLAGSEDGAILLGINDRDAFLQHPQLEIFFREVSVEKEPDLFFSPLIYQARIPGLLPVLSKGIISEDYGYFTFTGNYMLAASGAETLTAYLEALRFGYSFDKSEETQLMQEFMQQGQSMFIYFSPSASENAANSQENTSQISRSFSLQLLPSSGSLTFSNAMLLHRAGYNVSNPVNWEVTLKAPVHKGPFRVFNHNNRNTEFILQDQSHDLYLVDLEGNILWQKEISGPIVSDIFQVDIYKNERYQYLFNTRNYLHLVDRNGNYVQGYPMRLPAPASAGIAVFDYESNKNYRIIFPGENRRIYNYSLRRQPVAGWQFRQSEHLIKQPLQHIRLNKKDFLLATDTTGKVQILDRRGTSRLRPNQTLWVAPETRIYANEPREGKAHFVVPGNHGTISQVFTDGSVFSMTPDTLENDYKFAYRSFTGETENDLIFLHNGTIKVYNIMSRLIFSLPLGKKMEADFDILEIEDKGKFIGITDKTNSRLFLVNTEGEIPAPFPLMGDTHFVVDTDQNGTVYLITGLGNKLINYSLKMN